ncbi:MAG: hypothetical protein ACFFC7_08120 [Candidatus Hermodarchaeota archaeon]
MGKKDLNFPSEDEYWKLKVEATKNRQKYWGVHYYTAEISERTP